MSWEDYQVCLERMFRRGRSGVVLGRHSNQSRSSHALEDRRTTELTAICLSCICTPSFQQFKAFFCFNVVFEVAARSLSTVACQPRPELSLMESIRAIVLWFAGAFILTKPISRQ